VWRQGTSLIKVVDTLECRGVDVVSALRDEQVFDLCALLEGWAVLQAELAFALHERDLLFELLSLLLFVAYHLSHLGLCRHTLALGLEDLFLLLEVAVLDAQGAPSGVGCSLRCLLLSVSSSQASWWVVSTRALPFFSASSAALTASSDFELALLGAIAGGFFRSMNGVHQMLELALLGKLIQRGSESNVNKVLTRDGNGSVNIASQGHCAEVFIGA
jgi:hypothetical protein